VHPYMMREMIRQRTVERHAEARRISFARMARKALRERGRAQARDTFVPPAIPDYVDGTFRETGASAERASADR
jgi:hypothetical protein